MHKLFRNLKNVRYLEPPDILDANWDVSAEKLDKLKSNKCIINFSMENYGSLFHYYQQLTDYGLDFILLSFNPHDHLVKPNLVFYPYWLYESCENMFELSQTYKDIRTHKISCLNRNPRPHRIFNYITLQNKPWFNEILFTFSNFPDEDAYRNDDVILSNDIKDHWEKIRYGLPSLLPYDHITHPAFNNSYINFVTETTVSQGLFITEKTWKPIASEQLFLIYGNVGTIKHLRDIGVDTFDDIIDHNYYDNVTDWVDRLNRIHALIEDLLTSNLEQIFIDTKERRVQNRNNFINKNFGTMYTDIIKQQC